jgi:hypothetical protein
MEMTSKDEDSGNLRHKAGHQHFSLDASCVGSFNNFSIYM